MNMMRSTSRPAKLARSIASTLALSAFALGQSTDKQAFDLHVNTPVGKTFWFVETTAGTYENSNPDRSYTVEDLEHRTFAVQIKQVDANGSRIIEVFLARIHGWSKSTKTTTFDSDDLTGNKQLTHPALRMMTRVGRSVIARVDKNGKLAGSKEGLFDKAKTPQSKLIANDWHLAELGGSVFGPTPKQPAAPTDTWKFEQPDPANKRVTRFVTMTLDAATPDAFELSLAGTLKRLQVPVPPKKVGESPAHGFNRMMNARVLRAPKLKGRLIVSRHDGLVIEAESATSWSTQGETPAIRTKTTQTAKLRRTDKPETMTLRGLVSFHLPAAKVAKSQADVALIAKATRSYFAERGGLPKQLKLLATYNKTFARRLQLLPIDPWGNAYKMVRGETRGKFHIAGAGPDQQFGTEDDLLGR